MKPLRPRAVDDFTCDPFVVTGDRGEGMSLNSSTRDQGRVEVGAEVR